jgi:hypothetical protein
MIAFDDPGSINIQPYLHLHCHEHATEPGVTANPSAVHNICTLDLPEDFSSVSPNLNTVWQA